MTIKPYSFITSLLIIITSLYLIFKQGFTDLNSSLLLLGITSTIHHSRFDKWWINDIWKYLDYMAILIFFIIAFSKFKYNFNCLLFCLYSILIISLIVFNFVDMEYIPILHSTIHIYLCILIIYSLS